MGSLEINCSYLTLVYRWYQIYYTTILPKL